MNKRYWLKGGIIGSVINIVLTILIFVLSPFLGLMLTYFLAPFVSPFIFGVHPLLISTVAIPYFSWMSLGVYFSIKVLLPVMVYFLIGAIIGYLYGKNKNRKIVSV